MRRRFDSLLPLKLDGVEQKNTAREKEAANKENKLRKVANYILFGRPKAAEETQEEERKRRIFKYTVWFAISVFLSQVSMLLLFLLSDKPTGPWLSSFFALTFICTTGVLLSNHIVALRYFHHPVQAVIATLGVALLLLGTADYFSSLSEQVMGSFGFGENLKVNLLLNEEGDEIVDKLKLRNCTTASLCGVEILSKVGDEYYLSVDGRTLTLPKSTVRSLSSTDKRKRR